MNEKEVSRVGDRINPISVRSKRRITDALLELMQTTPFSKITIKDVVERAGLTRQTFYHNFETKEEVLQCRVDELSAGFFDDLNKHKIETWEDLLCCFFRYWQENADFVRLLMQHDQTGIFTTRLPLFYEAALVGDLKTIGLTDAEAGLWYAFLRGAVVNTLTTWLSSDGRISARRLAGLAVAMLDGAPAGKNWQESMPKAADFVEQLTTEMR